MTVSVRSHERSALEAEHPRMAEASPLWGGVEAVRRGPSGPRWPAQRPRTIRAQREMSYGAMTFSVLRLPEAHIDPCTGRWERELQGRECRVASVCNTEATHGSRHEQDERNRRYDDE